MAEKQLKWIFPPQGKWLHKAEKTVISLIAATVFILSLGEGFFIALAAALLFVAIYIAISPLISRIKKIEEIYLLKPPHLHITRKTRSKVKKEKVHLKKVVDHRFDRFFLAGTLLTDKKKRHVLFFNTKKELEQLVKHLPSKKKTTKKKK